MNEEKIIKQIRIVGILVILIVMAVWVQLLLTILVVSGDTNSKIDTIQHDLIERNHLDSLYHDHLKDCSFIDHESVKVGRNGVLYSQYHKSNGKNF